MGLREGQPGTAALLYCQEVAEEQELDLFLVFSEVNRYQHHLYSMLFLFPAEP